MRKKKFLMNVESVDNQNASQDGCYHTFAFGGKPVIGVEFDILKKFLTLYGKFLVA